MQRATCRVCGTEVEPDRHGRVVDCCSRLVPAPQPHRPWTRALNWWRAKVERAVLLAGHEYFGRVVAWVVVSILIFLAIAVCTGVGR